MDTEAPGAKRNTPQHGSAVPLGVQGAPTPAQEDYAAYLGHPGFLDGVADEEIRDDCQRHAFRWALQEGECAWCLGEGEYTYPDID